MGFIINPLNLILARHRTQPLVIAVSPAEYRFPTPPALLAFLTGVFLFPLRQLRLINMPPLFIALCHARLATANQLNTSAGIKERLATFDTGLVSVVP